MLVSINFVGLDWTRTAAESTLLKKCFEYLNPIGESLTLDGGQYQNSQTRSFAKKIRRSGTVFHPNQFLTFSVRQNVTARRSTAQKVLMEKEISARL